MADRDGKQGHDVEENERLEETAAPKHPPSVTLHASLSLEERTFPIAAVNTQPKVSQQHRVCCSDLINYLIKLCYSGNRRI